MEVLSRIASRAEPSRVRHGGSDPDGAVDGKGIRVDATGSPRDWVQLSLQRFSLLPRTSPRSRARSISAVFRHRVQYERSMGRRRQVPTPGVARAHHRGGDGRSDERVSSTRLGLLSRAQPLKVIAERYLDQLEHHNHSQFEWRVQPATSLVALAVN